MDIEYLLYLQQFRETVGSILTPLMNAVTKLSAGFLPIAMMCMIYWAFDRKAGRKILAGLGGGLFINGFLKLTFCVYRPWIHLIICRMDHFWLILLKCGEMHMKESDLLHPLSSAGYWKKDN